MLLTSFGYSIKATQSKLMHLTFHCTKKVTWTSLSTQQVEDSLPMEMGKVIDIFPLGESSVSVECSASSATITVTQVPMFCICLLPFYIVPTNCSPTPPPALGPLTYPSDHACSPCPGLHFVCLPPQLLAVSVVCAQL